MLVRKYAVGSLDVNYLKFYRDVEAIATEPSPARTWKFTARAVDAGRRVFSEEVADILDRLRVGFYRSRVRPIDFFADHDTLRCGLVTENQFVCGLTLALSAHDSAQVSREEYQAVASAFKNETGHIRYREFCQIADNGTFTDGI